MVFLERNAKVIRHVYKLKKNSLNNHDFNLTFQNNLSVFAEETLIGTPRHHPDLCRAACVITVHTREIKYIVSYPICTFTFII